MITNPEIKKYCRKHSSSPTIELARIENSTWEDIPAPNMLSGHLLGQFLRIISHIFKPKSILEIGTFTGYSTLCLAEALHTDGRMITIEKNRTLESRIQKNLESLGRKINLKICIGDSEDILPELQGPFDMIFMDAAKRKYARDYDMLFEKWELNGIMLVDNTLWKGKILDRPMDNMTMGIQEFNEKIKEDNRVENVLLPLEDGLQIIRKISE